MNAVRDFENELDAARAERDKERDEALAADFAAQVRGHLNPRAGNRDAAVEQLRVPPHSTEAEQSVLGGLMLAPDTLDRIAGKIEAGDFYRHDHRLIFRAIGELAGKGKPFDAVTLGDWFESQGQAELVANGAYLVDLANNIPSAANIVAYAEIVRDKAQMRKLIEVGTQIVNNGFQSEGRDSAALLAEAEQALYGVQTGALATYKPKRLQFLSSSEFLAEVTPPDWVIGGFAEADSFCVLFGDPASGKSFMALDWSCCVATGTPWKGRPIKQGPVLYLNGEGQRGVNRRLHAWGIANGIDLARAPLFLSNSPTQLTEPSARAELLNVVHAFMEAHGKPAVVVLDTLMRNFGPGDENSTQDMSVAVASIDAVRAATGALTVVVHHSGHGDKTRARGSIVLKAAADTEFRMTRLEGSEETLLENVKMKDGSTPEAMSFRFADVELGVVDSNGNDVVSAILTQTHHDPSDPAYTSAPPPSRAARGRNQVKAINTLQRLFDHHRANVEASGRDASNARVKLDEWRETLRADGMDFRRAHEVTNTLINAGTVIADGGFVSLRNDQFTK